MRIAKSIALALLLLPACSLLAGGNGLERLWRTAGPSDAPSGEVGSVGPLHFYAERGDALAAYSVKDGDLAWVADISHFCYPPPVAAGRVFCPSDDLTALDAETGRTLWSVTPDTTFQLVQGTADSERVYAGAYQFPGYSTIYSYDASTGALAWRRRVAAPDWTGSALRSLVLNGNTLFASADGIYDEVGFLSAPTILAYDATTGQELWRFQDGDGTQNLKVSDLTITNDVILYGEWASSDQTIALDRASREVRWRVDHRPGFAGTIAAPVVADGVVYTAQGDSRLYAIDLTSGDVIWDVEHRSGSHGNHAVCGDYFIGDTSALSVVERASGSLVEVLFKSREEVWQMAERDGRLYVATDEAAYAFDCR